MPGAYLVFDDTLRFDVVTNEQTEHSATATEHPVETGANIADHVRDQLDRVTLEVLVSNTPINDVNELYGLQYTAANLENGAALGNSTLKPKASIPLTPGALVTVGLQAIGDLFAGGTTNPFVRSFPAKFNAVKDAMDTLLDWKKRAVVGQVITPWHTFESMIIERVAPLRTAAIGDGAQIAIEFREIRTVETSLVNAPKPTEIRAKPAVKKGAQNPTPEDPTKSSVLFSIFG